MRRFHIDGSLPSDPDAVFVFGSNLAGIHGGGAAKAAAEKFGAVYGVGIGRTGNAYAIPTKDERIQTRELADIKPHVEQFITAARSQPETQFFVTRVGCVLAGYSDAEIAPMFAHAPNNCSLPEPWAPFVF